MTWAKQSVKVKEKEKKVQKENRYLERKRRRERQRLKRAVAPRWSEMSHHRGRHYTCRHHGGDAVHPPSSPLPSIPL